MPLFTPRRPARSYAEAVARLMAEPVVRLKYTEASVERACGRSDEEIYASLGAPNG